MKNKLIVIGTLKKKKKLNGIIKKYPAFVCACSENRPGFLDFKIKNKTLVSYEADEKKNEENSYRLLSTVRGGKKY